MPSSQAGIHASGQASDLGDQVNLEAGDFRASRALVSGDPLAATITSPFGAPAGNDRLFVLDRAPLLDTPCQFSGMGPLEFDIPITRYVGPVNVDGTLQNPAVLVNAGVIGPEVTLRFPADDVDNEAETTPPTFPEVDRVLFNGVEVGLLSGLDGIWKLNSFQVPVGLVRFPERAALGGTPAPALNRITIEIDTANFPTEVWCTSLDWAAIEIQAASPLVLLHEANSNPGFWQRQGFSPALEQAAWPFDDSLSLLRLPSEQQARELRLSLAEIAASFGVDSLHLAGHGSAGLDALALVAQQSADSAFEVLSLTTLGTPHNGSALADQQLIRSQCAAEILRTSFAAEPAFVSAAQNLIALSPNLADLASGGAAERWLQSAGAASFTGLRSLPLNTVSADADRNNNAQISQSNEIIGLSDESPTLAALNATQQARLLDRGYQALADAPRAHCALTLFPASGSIGSAGGTTLIGVLAASSGADAVSSLASQSGRNGLETIVANTNLLSGSTSRNHANMADATTANWLVEQLLTIEQAEGDLQ